MTTSLNTFDDALEQIRKAHTWDDLLAGGDAGKVFRALARLLHPDTAPEDRKTEATEAFARLNQLRDGPRTVVTTKVGTYVTRSTLGSDQLAEYLHGDTATHEAVLKVTRHPRDNDLMRQEAANLTTVVAQAGSFKFYLPELLDSFPYRDAATGVERQVNVFASTFKFVSLATIRDAFPDGLNGRHVAWIWRRILVALGIAHKAGVVHGAVVPDHILIEPDMHGLVLANWCYSASKGQRIPAVVARYRDWYPTEVLRKQAPTPHTDISMAMRAMTCLLDQHAPAELHVFANRYTTKSGPSAWELLTILDDVLQTVYGPRKFTPFPALPGGTPTWPHQGRM